MIDLDSNNTSFEICSEHSKITLMQESLKALPLDVKMLIVQIFEILHMSAEKTDIDLSIKKIINFVASDNNKYDHILKYIHKNMLTLSDIYKTTYDIPEKDRSSLFSYLSYNACISVFDCRHLLPEAIIHRPEVARVMIKRHGDILENYGTILLAIDGFVRAFEQAKYLLRRESLLATLESNRLISDRLISEFLKKDWPVDKKSILDTKKANLLFLKHAKDDLKDDKEVALAAVKNNCLAINTLAMSCKMTRT